MKEKDVQQADVVSQHDSRENTSADIVDLVETAVAASGVSSRAMSTKKEGYRVRTSCRIIVDSCADFAPSIPGLLGVEVIEFAYIDGAEVHYADGWKTQDPHEFYENMRKHPDKTYTTSAVTPGEYMEIFERYAKEGIPTIYLSFTAGLSSSYYAAQQAADSIREKYPDFELYVLDNLAPSAAAELLTIEAVRQSARGLTAREVYDWACDARYFIHGYFTLDSFDALAAGGRIPPAAAHIGSKLDIKPELTYDLTGALVLKGMCRGHKKALRAMLDDFKAEYTGDTSLPIAIVSTDAEKDADWLEKAIRKEKDYEKVSIIRSSVSPAIGAHVGPGMVALIFWGTDRRSKVSLADKIANKVRSRLDGE